MEGKSFTNIQVFLHEICQLHDETKVIRSKFLFRQIFPNLLNLFSIVVLLQMLFMANFLDFLKKKFKKNVNVK